MEGDDMDSLFEGMELFIPSQLSATDEQQQQLHTDHPSPPIPNSSESQPQIDASSIASTDEVVSSYSEPLDENLFSDLTLVTPLQSLPEQSNAISNTTSYNNHSTGGGSSSNSQTSSAISRQISRKKKRAAGLRIGYGRDTASDDLPSFSSAATNNDATMHLKHGVHVDDDDSVRTAESDTPSLLATVSTSKSSSEDDSLLQFEHIKAQISEKLKVAKQLADSVSAERKEAIRRRRKAAEKLDLVTANHRQLEVKLEEAIEDEDFEAAERISQNLAAAEEERTSLLNALKDADLHCAAIDAKMRGVLHSQIAAERECASLLHHFARDAENNADSLLEKAQTLSSKAQEDCFSSAATLEAKRIELDIESVFVKEARFGLDDSVEQYIQDDGKQKEILHQERETLTDELQKLLALVKQKEMQIAENDAKIRAVEERIHNVLSDFHEIQSGVDAKYDNLQAGLSEIHLQNEALSTKMKGIDERLTDERIRGSKLKELSKISEGEAKEYEAVVELREILKLSVLKSIEDKDRQTKSEEKLTEDVQMLQQELCAARAHLQELSLSKSSLQQNISSLKQRIIFIDKRIPELEAEKKVAATARNFKEAGRIAAEAKSLSVERDNVQMGLGKSTSQLEKLEEDISDTTGKLEETESLISSKEEEVAMARFQRLLLVAGAATAERSAALELGDTEEASLLFAEAEAAAAEAKKLQPMYNINEEEFSHLPKHFISMELVSKLGRKQLAELAASLNSSASQLSETK